MNRRHALWAQRRITLRISQSSTQKIQMKLETFEDSYPLSPMQDLPNFPKEVCIHQVFEAQKRTPDAGGEDEQLTYWELNYRANCLAHHLQSLGVGPEGGGGMERS